MNDIREHWSSIKAKREELEREIGDTVYIVSIDSKKRRIRGGVMSVASPHIAAMMIEDETHRLAEPYEIRDWQAGQKNLGDRIRKAAADKANTTQVHNHFDVANLLKDLGREEGNLRGPVIPPMGEAAPTGRANDANTDAL
jgi:hypothetical protein